MITSNTGYDRLINRVLVVMFVLLILQSIFVVVIINALHNLDESKKWLNQYKQDKALQEPVKMGIDQLKFRIDENDLRMIGGKNDSK